MGKRQLEQDMAASLPEKKRSRKGANSEAELLLESGRAIGDGQVLQVLRLWKFTEYTWRLDVMPRGADFVFSDTLGMVSTRTGVDATRRLTKRYTAVFKIHAIWFQQAWPMPYSPFTSISENFNDSAQLHRDSNNTGPSPTKSFGEFASGALRYFSNDGGTLPQLERQFSGYGSGDG